MAISSETAENLYTATGSLNVYAYTFRITDQSHLRVVVRDTDGDETELALTTDYTVSGVGESGGSVTLVDDDQAWLNGSGKLILNYVIGIFPKVPFTQPTDIKNNGNFFPTIHEGVFDRLTRLNQQVKARMDRSFRLPLTYTSASFNPVFPASLIGAPDKLIATNGDGDGLAAGPSVSDLSTAVTAADEAAASALAAAASASDAADAAAAAAVSASEAALSAGQVWSEYVEHAVTDGQSATDLSGETVDSDVYSSAFYEVEIIRGTTVFSNGHLAVQCVNSNWRVVLGGMIASEQHGVTFSVSQAGTVAQLRAALDSGAGNGTIKLSRRRVPA